MQVNNCHLIRGLIGRTGCGIYQMNGQPTAQNTRETGANGDLPGFRNWENPEHIKELAQLWNVSTDIFRIGRHLHMPCRSFATANKDPFGCCGYRATNPAVSLPDLPRIRKILDNEELFVVVQDAFMTETASRADVVLPAALWGEKAVASPMSIVLCIYPTKP